MSQQTRNIAATDEAAKQALLSAFLADSDETRYITSVLITKHALDAAGSIGQARTALAHMRGLEGSKFRRGDDAAVDFKGALAEVLLAKALRGSGAVIAPFVEYQPSPGADVKLDGKSFDIKGISANHYCMNVNKEKHEKLLSEYYVAVKLVETSFADIFIIPRDVVVRDGQLKEGFSPYYAYRLPRLAAVSLEYA